MSSDPEKIGTGGQYDLQVISLQQSENRPGIAAKKTGVTAGMFFGGKGHINASESDKRAQADTDDGRRAGTNASNSVQVCGVLGD